MTLNFGYSIGVFSHNIDALKVQYEWTDDNETTYVSVITTMVPLGGMVGVFIAGKLVGKGRLLTYILTMVLVVIGSAITLFKSIPLLIIGRFIFGFGACGLSSVVGPAYIEESSPNRLKGPLGGLTQFFIMLGIFFSYSIGYFTPTEDDNTK